MDTKNSVPSTAAMHGRGKWPGMQFLATFVAQTMRATLAYLALLLLALLSAAAYITHLSTLFR